jgi:hypothetical protein
MTRPIIQVGDTAREMTDAEHAQWQQDAADAQAAEAARAADADVKNTALASARAKLAALGLTDAEVAALLGG